MGDETAIEGDGAALGRGGEYELGVGEALLKCVIGGRGERGREKGGEERMGKRGGVRASAVQENEGLFVG